MNIKDSSEYVEYYVDESVILNEDTMKILLLYYNKN